MLLRNKHFSAIYGIVVALVALGYACLTFNFDPSIPTSQFSYMGYLLSASMLFASFLLVYGKSMSLKTTFVEALNTHKIEKGRKAFFERLISLIIFILP